MFVAPFTRSPIPICSTTASSTVAAASRLSRIRGRPCAHSRPLLGPVDRSSKASVLSDSLKILEWDKLCDAVASFAGTALGRDATKARLLSVDVCYDESRRLLEETAAAVELIKYGAGLDFTRVNTVLLYQLMDKLIRQEKNKTSTLDVYC